MRIDEWLAEAEGILRDAGVESARLDSELILADELGRERTYLHANEGMGLEVGVVERVNTKVVQRARRTPLAYVRGFREFYGRRFLVTEGVLVPRPETEEMIEVVKGLPLEAKVRVVDVGTGSGVIGITLWLEGLADEVFLVDKSARALEVARRNADELGAKVVVREGDLLEGVEEGVDVIVANLPYVDERWEVSPETKFEPREALFARDNGLELYTKLVQQAQGVLGAGGWLVMEADTRQHERLAETGRANGFELGRISGLIVAMRRV